MKIKNSEVLNTRFSLMQKMQIQNLCISQCFAITNYFNTNVKSKFYILIEFSFILQTQSIINNFIIIVQPLFTINISLLFNLIVLNKSHKSQVYLHVCSVNTVILVWVLWLWGMSVIPGESSLLAFHFILMAVVRLAQDPQKYSI